MKHSRGTPKQAVGVSRETSVMAVEQDAPGFDWNTEAVEELVAMCPEKPEGCIGQLKAYVELLYCRSANQSLISAGDRPNVVARHLLPALAMVPVASSGPHHTVLDFGSGAGLPGVPLKIMLPDANVILVESRRRRANFLREVVRELRLSHVEVVNKRMADWVPPASGVDLIVSRAAAEVSHVIEQTSHALSAKGRLIVTLSTASIPQLERSLIEKSVVWSGGELRLGLVVLPGQA